MVLETPQVQVQIVTHNYLCCRCNELKEHFPNPDTPRGYWSVCRDCRRIARLIWGKTPAGKECKQAYDQQPEVKAKQYDRKVAKRLKAMHVLGGPFCKHCGFDDVRALQFDHINGDGRIDRKNGMYPLKIVAEILKDPNSCNKYQVLCANCNWIKRDENKEYRDPASYTRGYECNTHPGFQGI